MPPSRTRGRRRGRGILRVDARAETAGGVAQVVADPARAGGLLLLLDGLASGYVDVGDPARLGLDYLHRLGAALDALVPRGAACDVVHLGGGAFALPRALAATRPGARQEVYEVDPAIVALARDRLRLKTSAALQVRVGDARALLERRPDASADVVVGDAFSGTEVPRHLTTVEFAEEVRRVLRPEGVYLLNVIDGAPPVVAPSVAAALLETFASVVVFGEREAAHGRRSGNVLLAASGRSLDPAALERRLSTGPHPSVILPAGAYTKGATPPKDE